MKLIEKKSCYVSTSKKVERTAQGDINVVKILIKIFKLDWRTYIFGILLCWICIFWFIEQDGEINYYGKYYSLADCYIRMLRPIAYSILMIPFLLVGTCKSTKFDFYVPQLLRRKSKYKIFLIQEIKLAGISSFYALIYSFGVSLAGIKKTELMINWGNMDSVFCVKNQYTLPNISLANVIILFFIITFIRNYLFSNIVLIIQWLCDNVTIGILIVVCIICFEITQKKIKILLWLFTLDYPVWINQSMRIKMMIFGIGYLLLTIFVFKRVINHKEFLHEK